MSFDDLLTKKSPRLSARSRYQQTSGDLIVQKLPENNRLVFIESPHLNP